MVASQAPEPSFPRAGTEIVTEGDMLSALPVPRCSSEVIKPSELFLDLMMLDPLKKELDPTFAGGNSTSSNLPSKPVQRPCSRSLPKADSPAKAPARPVAVVPQEAKPIIDWGQPQLCQVAAPAPAASASMKLPTFSSAVSGGSQNIPPPPTGFTPLQADNYRLAQPINASINRASGLLSSMQREASPTSSPSKMGAQFSSYSLQLPPKASYQQVMQPSQLQALPGASMPLTALASSMAVADLRCSQPNACTSRSVAVPASSPRLVQQCWPTAAPASMPMQYRQITPMSASPMPAQLSQGARAWMQAASPAPGARFLPSGMTLPAASTQPAQPAPVPAPAPAPTPAPASTQSTAPAPTPAPAPAPVQAQASQARRMVPATEFKAENTAPATLGAPASASLPPALAASAAPAAPVFQASHTLYSSAPAARMQVLAPTQGLGPAQAQPAPASSAAPVTTLGGYPWRQVVQPYQYQAYSLNCGAPPGSKPLQRASLPTAQPHPPQPFRFSTATQLQQTQTRPPVAQAPIQLASSAPRQVAMPAARTGLGAEEVALMAAARYPLP